MRKLLGREDVVALQQGYTDRLQEMLGPEHSSELQELGASLSRELGRFAPGAELTLEWDEVPPVALQLPSARASVVEDAFPGHISRKGHGLQRAMVLILLQEMAKMQVEAETGPSLILGIEEPELFLHPARARYLSGLLHDLVAESGSDIIGQVIYTTHSPHFLDLHRFDSIRVIRKVATEEGVPLEVDVQAFELVAAIGELARITDQPVELFTRDSFVARTVPVMTTVVNEGFFADGVVLVEGLSDAAAIWVVQERLGKNWSEQDVVVIPVSGKNNLDRPTIILRGLGIPTYFVFDGDGDDTASGDEHQKTIAANHRCQRLAGVPEDDFPSTRVERDWACLRTNLEGELKAALEVGVFDEIRRQVADHLGYARVKKVLKNADCVAEFVTHVYERGLTLPFLERIVEAATALLCPEEQ
jgi:hypothetical protein